MELQPPTQLTRDGIERTLGLSDGSVAIIVDAGMLQRLGLHLPGEPTISEADADTLFERSLYRRELSEKTRARYRANWREFKNFMATRAAGRNPVLATDDDLEEFVNYLQSSDRIMPDSAGVPRSHPLKASSICGVLACLSNFFAQCQKKRYRFDNPT